MADQLKGIQSQNPTIAVINNGGHAVLVKGTNWTRLSDAIQRPSSNYMYIHDPWPGFNPQTGAFGGASIMVTVGQWANISMWNSTCNCSAFVQSVFQRGSGDASLTGFDLDGGRYLGPTPANPTGRYMRAGDGACYWEPNDSGANQCSGAGPGAPDTLSPAQRIYPSGNVYSSNGSYRLTYQGDGNLVLYTGGTPIWATMTLNSGAGYTEMQTDGNFVVYDSGIVPVWASMTNGNNGAWLRVENDGRLTIYNQSNNLLWSDPW